MKKVRNLLLVSVFMFAVMALVGCNFTKETEIEFVSMPKSAYNVGYDANKAKAEITVKIKDGSATKTLSLNDPSLQVTGLDFSTKGTYTLVVKYDTVSISYAYLVVDGAEDDTVDADTSWYNTEANAFSLYDEADMLGFAQIVNNGTDTFENKTVFLMKDINLSEIIWSPIGEGSRKVGDNCAAPNADHNFFMGTFDGGNHEIKGLTDFAYIPAAGTYMSNAMGKEINGATFGLFGRTCNATIKNVVMSNVNITGFASYDTTNYTYLDVKNDSVAAIVGYSWLDLTVQNCKVLSGTIAGDDAVAGIVGRAYGDTDKTSVTSSYKNDNECTVSIINCQNFATIRATEKVAGLVAYAEVGHLVGTGSTSTNTVTGGIVAFQEGNSNSMNLSGK